MCDVSFQIRITKLGLKDVACRSNRWWSKWILCRRNPCQGRDREEAIQRIQRSLGEFVIEGITTTIDLHKKILSHKKFINSDFDVNWLGKENFY